MRALSRIHKLFGKIKVFWHCHGGGYTGREWQVLSLERKTEALIVTGEVKLNFTGSRQGARGMSVNNTFSYLTVRRGA